MSVPSAPIVYLTDRCKAFFSLNCHPFTTEVTKDKSRMNFSHGVPTKLAIVKAVPHSQAMSCH